MHARQIAGRMNCQLMKNRGSEYKVKHDSVVVPSMVNLAESVLARTVHEFMQSHSKLVQVPMGSQLHKS